MIERYEPLFDQITAPPPRDYGIVDQIKRDLEAPLALAAWTFVFAAIVAGVALQHWPLALIALGIGLWLARGSFDAITFARRSELTKTIIETLGEKGPIGIEEEATFAGQSMRLHYPVEPVKGLLTLGPVEAWVMYDPKNPRLGAHVFAIRPASNTTLEFSDAGA